MAKAKILVVEDEAITAMDIKNRLKELDYDVPAIAASGEGAIKSVEEIEPDLVVMDLILKGDMDGIEAAELIRDRFDIPVVYVTASLDEARLEKTKVTEPYGYITKPFEDKALRSVIEMALQRHKLERVLRTAEQDWRNSFNSLEDVMLIVDRDYNIENINECGRKLLGKSKEEVIGQKCYQVISGMDSPGEECPCMKSLETKKVESLDRYEEVFGKYYSIKCSPIFDENGEITKFVDLRRDITERTHLMKERENSHKFLEAIIENIPDAVYLKDSQYRFSLVNQAYCDLFGVKKEEIIRKERVYETDKEIFQTGKAVEIQEQSFTDHKGKRHYTHLKKVPLIDNLGNVTHVLTISRDITERKRAEESLTELQQYTRALIETSLDPLVSISSDGAIIDVNPAMELVTGYHRERLIGTDFSDYFTDPQKARQGYQQVFCEGDLHDYPLEIKHRDGKVTSILYNASVYHDSKGDVAGVFAAARDITERKRAEEEREKKNEELRRFNKLAVGRELRMIELKKEINALLEDLGKEPRYRIAGE